MGQLRDFFRARATAPYSDDERVGWVTRQVVGAGCTILQSHKLAGNDDSHVRELLHDFDLPAGAHVLDVGCGVGAVAATMTRFRADLSFTLFNYSRAQLAMCPPFGRVCGDFHRLPFAAESFDVAMYCFSLGHGLLSPCLREAARVIRPGGSVCIYDLTTYTPEALVDRMGYRPHRIVEVEAAAGRHGLLMGMVVLPRASTLEFMEVFGEDAFVNHGFADCWPVIYRLTKL